MEYTQIAIPLIIALVITAIATPITIYILKRYKAGQSIREEGPKSHMSKAGTPTMGGIAIIIGAIAASIIVRGVDRELLVIVAAFIAFGLLGFLDDFVKVVKKRNLGLTAKQKFALQVVIAVIIAVYQCKVSVTGTSIYVPFAETYWDLGWIYIPFVAFVIVAMANSVNLTDGLDGLAAGTSLIVSLFLAIVGVVYSFASASVFCAAVAGACIGFLFFNRHPAKVFMGDTGSLALGGGLAVAAILMNMELIIPIAGGVFLAETVSVILQVTYFKVTKGKRLFRMSPLHHHFELCGWKETKVVAVFWVVTLILCVIALLGL
ncbi:MAG: phospho-N-acetylmuramoyl-pentapeptide-transferase [Clostridiales bacterium]|nr:phospho-N-acetylmuramoyl-pentapeptide-transferase [Clostridiales bacterium]